MKKSNRFVADGYRRAYVALEPIIRAEVAGEFAERMRKASSFWERWLIEREMKREIVQRIHEKAPPDALY